MSPSPPRYGGEGEFSGVIRASNYRGGGPGGAHAEQVADRDEQVGTVQRVEMEFGDAVSLQAAALLGGQRGGNQPAGVGIVVEAVEMRAHPGRDRSAAARRHALQLREIGDRQNTGYDRHLDAGR